MTEMVFAQLGTRLSHPPGKLVADELTFIHFGLPATRCSMDIAGTGEPQIIAPISTPLDGAGVAISPRCEPAGKVEAKGSISP